MGTRFGQAFCGTRQRQPCHWLLVPWSRYRRGCMLWNRGRRIDRPVTRPLKGALIQRGACGKRIAAMGWPSSLSLSVSHCYIHTRNRWAAGPSRDRSTSVNRLLVYSQQYWLTRKWPTSHVGTRNFQDATIHKLDSTTALPRQAYAPPSRHSKLNKEK